MQQSLPGRNSRQCVAELVSVEFVYIPIVPADQLTLRPIRMLHWVGGDPGNNVTNQVILPSTLPAIIQVTASAKTVKEERRRVGGESCQVLSRVKPPVASLSLSFTFPFILFFHEIPISERILVGEGATGSSKPLALICGACLCGGSKSMSSPVASLPSIASRKRTEEREQVLRRRPSAHHYYRHYYNLFCFS